MKIEYSQDELDGILTTVSSRIGWNFSVMKTLRQPVPWDYTNVVSEYLTQKDSVLDVGTGGGERFIELAPYFGAGLGVDIDPVMIETAKQNAKDVKNIEFTESDASLGNISQKFNVIVNRHCALDLIAIKEHLAPGGYFITQQVGEKNMNNIKIVLNQQVQKPTITKSDIETSGLRLVSFCEYDVEYVVKDIESLVFWLKALDMLHADLSGAEAISDVNILNEILKGNVDDRGFVTNEHRYLVVAQA